MSGANIPLKPVYTFHYCLSDVQTANSIGTNVPPYHQRYRRLNWECWEQAKMVFLLFVLRIRQPCFPKTISDFNPPDHRTVCWLFSLHFKWALAQSRSSVFTFALKGTANCVHRQSFLEAFLSPWCDFMTEPRSFLMQRLQYSFGPVPCTQWIPDWWNSSCLRRSFLFPITLLTCCQLT